MYNDEFNSYHFTNRDDLPRDDYTPTPRPQPELTPTPKRQGFFRRTWVKVTALVLACAVVGGAAGYGGASLANSGSNEAAIQESGRKPVTVQIKAVNGLTKMDPNEVYASTVNSTVSINCSATSTNVFGQTTQSASSGSGFIITQDGYVVTNHHVVAGASSIKVTLYNGDTYDAALIGSDSDYDVAVLKINAEGLQPVTLGDSADVNVGDYVLAIGNPLGELTFSMSQGIVSSCNRAINVDGTPFNMIQVDCSINPGNSGGPLMNLYGEVVGIVSAKYSSYSDTTVEGLGFAIPIGDVQAIITDIMENGQVTDKPSFGITAGTMTEQMAAQYQIEQKSGAFVYSVNKGGAGEKAGLRMGDVITKVDSTDIASMEDLTAAKKGHKAGDTVTVTYFRDGSSHTTSLTFDVKADDTVQDSQQGQQNQQDQQDQQNGGNSFGSLYDYFFGRG